MDLLYADFETFYSTEYSLRHLDPPSYILDPRFEMIMCGVAFNDGPTSIIERDDIPAFFQAVDPNKVALVSHNSQFDASILSWRLDWRPKLIIDTLSMSRTIIANRTRRHDLGSVSEYLGFEGKDIGALVNVKGLGYDAIKADPNLWDHFVRYCLGDVNKCRNIFKALAPKMPDEEFLIQDQVLRMAVDPVLHADVTALSEHLHEVQQRKELLFARAMLLGIESKKDLMSNDRFAKVLENFGVDPPRKISPTTGLPAYAFAKSDDDFQELREHENPIVRDLVEARLGYKSTIEETRAARLLNIGMLEFPHHGANMMPIALRCGAARTHRLGGDWKCNFQNLGRKSLIRKGITADEGHLLVAADAAQIEARFLAWYCGQKDLLDAFASGEDVYASFASRIFHMAITALTHPRERFLGKTAVLGCGYGCGPDKFIMMVKALSALAGNVIVLTLAEAEEIIRTYRQANNMITAKWEWLRNNVLPVLGGRGLTEIKDGPIIYSKETVTGPNGLTMQYPELRRDGAQWLYNDAGSTNKLYHGKLIENVIQFLARTFIMQVAARLKSLVESLDGRWVLQVHDELVYHVPIEHVETLSLALKNEMSRAPLWAPGLPLATDVHVGHTYGDTK